MDHQRKCSIAPATLPQAIRADAATNRASFSANKPPPVAERALSATQAYGYVHLLRTQRPLNIYSSAGSTAIVLLEVSVAHFGFRPSSDETADTIRTIRHDCGPNLKRSIVLMLQWDIK
jgi:hypothetical protein